jgi:GT2 family glycosyltransferase
MVAKKARALAGRAAGTVVRRLPGRSRTAAERLAAVRTLVQSPLFDTAWYAEQTGTPRGRAEAAWHYLTTGRRRGLSPHPFVEPGWVSPDGAWRRGGGLPELAAPAVGRSGSPHPLVDLRAWVAAHPRAAKHPGGPLAHLAASRRSLVLPRPEGDAGPRTTVGDLHRLVREHAREWRADDDLVHAERVQDHHDAEADAAYVRRWSAHPLPAAEDGAPLVSVVMPVRDRATTVLAAIASVRAQTLTDWELVVVDDGSTDATPEVVAEIARVDPRVRLVRGEAAGVSRARNTGQAHARGRYLAWLDSDNTWVPHFLRVAVAAMSAAGVRLAYAQSELVTPAGRQWRALDGGVELLAVRNHVDLNVLVAEREIVEAAGGFDETLRRTVDYDLVWRLASGTRLLHLPFVGVLYDDDADSGADRITTRELFSWKEVVRNKHLVDWDDLRTRAWTPGLTSLVVVARTGWQDAWTTVLSALDDVDAAGAPEVVVVDSGLARTDSAVLRFLARDRPGVRVVRLAADGIGSLSANVGLAASSGDVVVVAREGVTGRPGWVGALREGLDAAGAAAAQPLVVAADGAVVSAGAVPTGAAGVPARLLEHLLEEDARRLPSPLVVPALDSPVVAVRSQDLAAVTGLDPLYVSGWEHVDLSLRLREEGLGDAVTVVDSVVTAPPTPRGPGHARRDRTDRQLFAQRWQDRAGERDDAHWEALGLRVERYVARGERELPPVLRRPSPVLTRPATRTASGEPALRWAIRTGTPAGPDAPRWGDHHFAHALKEALERLGQQVVVDYRGTLDRPTTDLDDVVLALRGIWPLPYVVGSTNLLWVISHPELVDEAELAAPEAVFSASPAWARQAAERSGREVEPMLQATDAQRFHPDVAEPGTGDPVLFVGNSRNVYRPVVRHLVEAGVPLSVYGGRWEQFLPPGVLRGTHLPNAELAARYRAAGVVLNDHWDEMRLDGFVSNRLFDAAAVGARVVSDEVEGVEELFPGVVRTFADPQQLVDLVRDADSAFADDERRREVAERVRREHSFDARARTLLDTVLRLRGEA